MSATKTPRGRFARRLAAVVLVLVIVPLVVVGWQLRAVNEEALDNGNRELLFFVLDDVTNTIESDLAGARTGLTAVGTLLNDDAPSADRAARLKELVAVLPDLGVIGLYDEHGVQFDIVHRAADTSAIPGELTDEMRHDADVDGSALGRVTRGPKGPVVPIFQPIVLPHAHWYACTVVTLAGIDKRVADIALQQFAALDSVFIVDRDLRVIVHPDLERALAMVDVSNVGIFAHLESHPLAHHESLLEYATYPSPDGVMFGAIRVLPATRLAVVAQLPRARVYSSVARMLWIIAIVIGIVALLAAAAAILIARRLSAPIEKLVAYTRELAARRFDAVAGVHTGDELEVLGNAMTDAAQALAASDHKLLEEAAIRGDLGRYLPAQLVDKVVRREQSLQLGGHRRAVTVLFADVASFTTLTENHPPEVVVTILNQLFTILTEIVFRHGGTVDKFIGDCVMAFWNAPDDQPDHAARALGAATDMLRWLEIGNEAWQAKYGVTIRLAIGVNTGDVVVGNFGSESRMTYTCIGDSVNVAARLEGIARPQQILASRATRDAAADAFDYIPLGPQRLPGRVETVDVFEVSV